MNVAKAWCVEVGCKRKRSMLAKFDQRRDSGIAN